MHGQVLELFVDFDDWAEVFAEVCSFLWAQLHNEMDACGTASL